MARDNDIPDQQDLLDFLKRHGWDEEKAQELLKDKCGLRTLQIPGAYLLDVLQEVSQEGVSIGDTTVLFLVPKKNWTSFQEKAAQAIAKHGGFVVTSEEKALMDSVPSSEVRH